MEKPTKRCPFCDGEGVLQKTILCPVKWYLYCRNCGIETPVFSTTEETLKFWNTRVFGGLVSETRTEENQ